MFYWCNLSNLCISRLRKMISKILKSSPVFLLLFLLTACQSHQSVTVQKEWQHYKAKFVLKNGRVVDTGNGGISHSEGQGYGLLLAVRSNDRESFDKIWLWSQQNLQVRKDNLFIWRRRPNFVLEDEDMNNASDGDILISWALLEASQQWQDKKYQQEALKIIADVKQKLIVSWNGLEVLLPAAFGFNFQNSIDINLSYWIFPAISMISVYDNDPIWERLQKNGIKLLQQARFGRWQLPSDWIRLEKDNTFHAIKSQRFGYDAVRIPLNLIWGGYSDEEILAPFAEYWLYYGSYTPSWIAVNENTMDAWGADIGIRAIKHLTLLQHGDITNADFETISEWDYYQATLSLLSKLCYQQITS